MMVSGICVNMYIFCTRFLVPSYASFTKDALLDEVDNVDQSIDLQEILNEVDRLGWCEYNQ